MIYEIYSQRKWEGSATEGAEKTEPLSPAFLNSLYTSTWQKTPSVTEALLTNIVNNLNPPRKEG